MQRMVLWARLKLEDYALTCKLGEKKGPQVNLAQVWSQGFSPGKPSFNSSDWPIGTWQPLPNN